jgi:hypothetical protein
MAETYGSLIDYIQGQLLGFVTDPPSYGTLTNVCNPSDLTVALSLSGDTIPQGVIEVDDELIFLSDYDESTGVGTVPPWGRGQQGTTAAAHLVGSRITVNPKYPRRRVAEVINQVVAGMCPPLFAVRTGQFQASYLTWEYALPVGTRSLYKAEYRPFNASVYDWTPLRDATIKWDTGAPVLHVGTMQGILSAEVRYTVMADPTPLVNDGDLFTTTGLPESAVDVVSLGTIPRLVTTVDLARQQLNSVEPSERSLIVPAGSGANSAKFYLQMYQMRLEAEANKLRQQYPLKMMRNF